MEEEGKGGNKDSVRERECGRGTEEGELGREKTGGRKNKGERVRSRE